MEPEVNRDPCAEAEAQTELCGSDMDIYTKKVGGLEQAVREAATLKLELMRMQQVPSCLLAQNM